jgi:hypothetical protein
VKRTTEKSFSRGEYLWDRKRSKKEFRTTSMTCIMARDHPKKAQAKLVNTLFVPTLVI